MFIRRKNKIIIELFIYFFFLSIFNFFGVRRTERDILKNKTMSVTKLLKIVFNTFFFMRNENIKNFNH